MLAELKTELTNGASIPRDMLRANTVRSSGKGAESGGDKTETRQKNVNVLGRFDNECIWLATNGSNT